MSRVRRDDARRSDARRQLRWLPLGVAGSVILVALSACAAGAAGPRPGAAPPPEVALPPSAAATPPAAAAPDSPVAMGESSGTAAPIVPTAPPSPASGPSPASSASAATAASSRQDKMLPPCVPVRRARPKHHKPKEAPAPETPASNGPPPPAPADALVDARVGEVGTSLGSILGRDVTNPKGEDLGRVVDVLADSQGRVRAAIIDFGGFLGVGTRRIAVDWPLLRFDLNSGDKPLILAVDRQKLQSAPEYHANKPQVLVPPAAPDAPDAAQTKK
jgi:hypothetical protein